MTSGPRSVSHNPILENPGVTRVLISYAGRKSVKAREPPSEPPSSVMISSTGVSCGSLPALAVRMCCRESKTVQYGVQFHPPSGRQGSRKAGVKLQTRGPSAHEIVIGTQTATDLLLKDPNDL